MFTDRYYNNIILAKELLKMKCYLIGTIKVNWNRIPAQIRKLKFLADKKKQCMKKIIPRFLRRRIKDTMFSSFNYTGMNYKNITWWNIMSVKKPEILNYSTNMSSAN